MANTPAVRASLDGVRGKIGRAKDHLEDLKRAIEARPNTEAFQRFGTDEQSQEGLIEFAVKDAPEVSMTARLLIGDVVHALAAALDHLVYQLSLSHQLTINATDAVTICDGHKTHFPIFKTETDARKRRDAEGTIEKRLKLMAQAPADLIRSMQPYKRAELDPSLNSEQDPLWILFRLDVIDKHRVVLATAEHTKPKGIEISHPDQGAEMIEISDPVWKPFKHGTKLLTLTLDPGARPKPDVKFHLFLESEIRFAETGLWCDDKPVVALLRKLIEFIEIAVVNRLAKHVV